jgi:hypothetical protein
MQVEAPLGRRRGRENVRGSTFEEDFEFDGADTDDAVLVQEAKLNEEMTNAMLGINLLKVFESAFALVFCG